MEALEQTGSIQILLFLDKSEAATLTDLKDGVNCSLSAVYNALRKLKDAGLIEERMEDTFPRRRLISLTEKGRKVAGKLNACTSRLTSASGFCVGWGVRSPFLRWHLFGAKRTSVM